MNLHPLLLCAALAAPFFPLPAQADDMGAPLGSLGVFHVRVESLKERAFRSTVRQRYDFSCGSAALATLLNFHYGTPTREEDTFAAMYRTGDQAKIQRVGFSMADMKRYLDARGFQANGFKVGLDDFAQAGIPAIVLINNGGYRHFVVVKGISASRVLIGDPALGTRTLTRPEFEANWGGVVFVILNRKEQGQRSFNRDPEWRVREPAPLSAARYDPAFANVPWLRPPATDF